MTNKDKLIHFVYVKYITCIKCWNIVLVAVNISCQKMRPIQLVDYGFENITS